MNLYQQSSDEGIAILECANGLRPIDMLPSEIFNRMIERIAENTKHLRKMLDNWEPCTARLLPA